MNVNEGKEILNCAVVQDLLPLYHDKVVSGYTAAAVEQHLADCNVCTEEYQRLCTQLPETPAENLPKRFGVKLKRLMHKGVVKGALITAAAAVFLGGSLYFLTDYPLKTAKAESLDVLCAYYYDFTDDSEINSLPYITDDELKGFFIYYKTPLETFAEGRGMTECCAENGKAVISHKIPLLRLSKSNDQQGKIVENLMIYPQSDFKDTDLDNVDSLEYYGFDVPLESEELPDYVREYIIFQYDDKGGSWDQNDGYMTRTFENGESVTWDIDGNVIEQK